MAEENKTEGKEINVNKHYMRASVDAATINKKDRTVDVTFATDTPVLTSDYELGDYYEVLSFDPSHVRTQRINASAPVLDMHRKYVSVKDGEYLGVIVPGSVKFDFVAKKARATLKFSKHSDLDRVWQDIEDGILNNLSVGYDVFVYREVGNINPKNTDQIRTLEAVDWEPKEISVVLIPADINSGMNRSEENSKTTHKARILTDNKMTEEEKKAARKAERERSASIIEAVEKAGLPASFARTLIENDEATVEKIGGLVTSEKERVAKEGERKPAAEPAKPEPVVATTEQERMAKEGAVTERYRQAEIRKAVKLVRMTDTEAEEKFTNDLIDNGTPLDQARGLIMQKFMEQDPHKQTSNVHVNHDSGDKIRAAMEMSVRKRATPGFDAEKENKEIAGSEMFKKYRFMTMGELAKECVRAAGGNPEGHSPREVARFALNLERGAGMMSSSDFPIILGNLINRVLRDQYALAPQTWKPFCRQSSFKDFRDKHLAQIGDLNDKFTLVVEGGEYKRATMSEAMESYRALKYGMIVPFTWESIINDDLGAFDRVPTFIAQKAASLESDIVWSIITGNPTMGDGTALFHADHGNLASAPGAIDVSSLNDMHESMMLQKSLGGEFLALSPQYLLIPPSMRLKAAQYVGGNSKSMLATKGQDINPDYIRDMQTIVEPRLQTLGAWFGVANPGLIDTIEYSYLEGENGLFTERKQGFEVDGIEIKARLVFGAKAIDSKPFYKNAGS